MCSFGPIAAFSYIAAQKALLYRSIMQAFAGSRDRFVFTLRLQDVVDRVGVDVPVEIEKALIQLCEWGNLQTVSDDSDVGALEDFYKQRHVYRMTGQGEAVERALELFSSASERGLELHGKTLVDLRHALRQLRQLMQDEVPDAFDVHRSLMIFRLQFENLSAASQEFVDRLEQRAALQLADARRLIDQGHRFLGELVDEADGIAEIVLDIEAAGLDRLVQAVGRRQWQRFRGWFISTAELPSNLEVLRERVRTSMLSLLSGGKAVNAVNGMNRINRSGDFRVLASWFAQAKSDTEAHTLWRAAFGLGSARHLAIDDATLDQREAQDISVNTSWLDAPPLQLSRWDRGHRRNNRTSGLSRIIDRSAEKEKLADAAQEETQRLLNAQRRFGSGNRMRLSELSYLDVDEFELFIDLIGEAVSTRVFSQEAVEIVSGDGSLRVNLEPTGDDREALILTADGMFSGPDHWITIEPIAEVLR